MTERELCGECGGNGVVKIPGGVSVCPRCNQSCYEPDTPKPPKSNTDELPMDNPKPPAPAPAKCQHQLRKEAHVCRHGLATGTTCEACIAECPECWDSYSGARGYCARPQSAPAPASLSDQLYTAWTVLERVMPAAAEMYRPLYADILAVLQGVEFEHREIARLHGAIDALTEGKAHA